MTDSFSTHCFIEFYYRLGKGFLNEHNSVFTFKKLNESYGVFDGCRELAEMLSDKVLEFSNSSENTASALKIPVNNNWIQNISLRLYHNPKTTTMASYQPEESNLYYIGIKSEIVKFSPLVIRVNLSKTNNKRSLIITFMHELTHAYEDYNRNINGKENLTDRARRTGYSLNNIGTYDDEYLTAFSYMLYYIETFERNAYMTELKAELETCNTHFLNIEEIIKYLKSLNVYTNYKTVIEYIDFFSNLSDEVSQQVVFNWLGHISNLKFKTYKQFSKFLKQKGYQIERKFNTLIPKIAYEYLNFGNTLNNFNGQLSPLKHE